MEALGRTITSKRALLALRHPLEHSGKKIFFMHVPKCGGTSIDQALRVCFARSSVGRLDFRASMRAAELLDKDMNALREELLFYFMSKKSIKYVSGHFPFSEAALHQFTPEWDFLTVLRNPVARFFSLYFFNSHKRDDHFRINEDLETFVDSELALNIGRSYVNRLSSYEGPMTASREAIDEAIANLEGFRLVGCLEDLDGFLRQFQQLYGVKLPIGHANKNPLPPSQQRGQISKQIRSRVEEICQPDLEVYDYARSRLAASLDGREPARERAG